MTNPSRPQLHASQWFNTAKPIQLDALRGQVVAIHTFQMLSPGCVAHGLPQAVRLRDTFAEGPIAVIGLHTVFEHHSVMGPDALAAFIHEYRLSFPIGVDEASSSGPVPKTMASWGPWHPSWRRLRFQLVSDRRRGAPLGRVESTILTRSSRWRMSAYG